MTTTNPKIGECLPCLDGNPLKDGRGEGREAAVLISVYHFANTVEPLLTHTSNMPYHPL